MDMQNQAWSAPPQVDIEAWDKDFRDKAEGILPLVQAACILMAADPRLSPNDAVADVLQLYAIILKNKNILAKADSL